MEPYGVPLALRERIGDAATREMLELIDVKGQEGREEVLDQCSDRFERRLAVELGGLRGEMADGFANVGREVTGMGKDLRREVAALRFDVLKWSFVFWIGQVATIGALLSYLLRPGRQ